MNDDETNGGAMGDGTQQEPALRHARAGVDATGTDADAGALPFSTFDVGPRAAFRIRRRAIDELGRERQRAAHPITGNVATWYRRALEPAMLIGLGLSYCAWAAAGALALLH